MFLKDRDWSFPLEDLDRKFDEHYDVTAEKFHEALSDFLREWHFLEIIWGRIQADLRAFYESSSQSGEATKQDFKQNVKMHRLMNNSFDCIQLDTHCFFLTARILMDRIAQLTKMFWSRISGKKIKHENFRSFEKLKNKIKRLYDAGKIIDEDYAEHVFQKTDWFDNELRDIRNKLIAHRDERFYIDGFKPNSATVIKGKAVFSDKNKKVTYVQEYIPDLNKLMDNIYNFLNFFDKHFSQML